MEIYTYARRINMRRALPVWPRFEKEERENSATIAHNADGVTAWG